MLQRSKILVENIKDANFHAVGMAHRLHICNMLLALELISTNILRRWSIRCLLKVQIVIRQFNAFVSSKSEIENLKSEIKTTTTSAEIQFYQPNWPPYQVCKHNIPAAP